jgi:copper chaperone CopZ
MNELRFQVPGMTCGHCESAVRKEVTAIPGVVEVQVNLETKDVVVRGDNVSTAAVIAAVDEAGFEAVGLA